MVLLLSPNDQAPSEVSAFELSRAILEWFDHQDSHPSIVSVTPTKVKSKNRYHIKLVLFQEDSRILLLQSVNILTISCLCKIAMALGDQIE